MLNTCKKLIKTSFLLCLFNSSICFGTHYKAQDLRLSASNSYAAALNNQGAIAGKIKQEENFHDFLWSPEKGLTILTQKTSNSLPVINQQGEMAGVYWQNHQLWWDSSLVKHFYTHDLKLQTKDLSLPSSWKEETLSSWQTASYWDENTLAVYSMTDHPYFLVADHFDPTQAKKFAVWHPTKSLWGQSGKFEPIEERFLSQAWLMNNQGIILGKRWKNSENGSIREVVLYDFDTKTVTPLFKDAGYTLTGFNDKGQICGWRIKHKSHEMEGFFWDAEKGLQSLGNFLPRALNNQGHMVGNLKTDETIVPYYASQYKNAVDQLQNQKLYKWNPAIWQEGEIHLLEDCLDIDNLPWTTILSFNAINDRGEILGQAILDNAIQTILLVPLTTNP